MQDYTLLFSISSRIFQAFLQSLFRSVSWLILDLVGEVAFTNLDGDIVLAFRLKVDHGECAVAALVGINVIEKYQKAFIFQKGTIDFF